MKNIPLIIPAYEPGDNLIELLKTLQGTDFDTIILVDDGSGDEYAHIFAKAKEVMAEKLVLLTHSENRGKGAALKTAFRYVLENMDDAVGVVTADCDGQHDAEGIARVRQALLDNENTLILGVRHLIRPDIPWKSSFGNSVTQRIVKYLSGMNISDTQTGLRGIPFEMLEDLTHIEFNRFEYEMKMLLQTVNEGRFSIKEIPVKTIYESKDDHSTHFRPVMDSIRIYRILGAQLGRFFMSSLSSAVLDMILFQILCSLFRGSFFYYVALSTVIARVISATYNYMLNHKIVFKSRKNIKKTAAGYVTLAAIQMSLSATLVSLLVFSFDNVPEVVFKLFVDVLLFFVSYRIQQKYVF